MVFCKSPRFLSPFVPILLAATTLTMTLGGAVRAQAEAAKRLRTIDRIDTPLDGVWKFYRGNRAHAQDTAFNDGAWESVTLPHTWNARDGEDGGRYTRGHGWYRTHYTAPASDTGRRLFLQFDAASLTASVYVNGALVGEHRGGFAAFRFDVTKAMRVGSDNVIAVKVDNSDTGIIPLLGDFTVFGGLYRKARIISTDPVHLRMDDYGSEGVFFTPSHVTSASADLKILAEVQNDAAVKRDIVVTATVFDARGEEAAKLTKSVTLDPGAAADVVQDTVLKLPHLWDGLADPYLYHVSVQLSEGGRVIDAVRQPLGFRAFAISPDSGFSLNGKYLDLHGVNKHQDAMDKGWAAADSDQDTDFALVKEIGATMIRLSHYQHSQHTLDLCDRTGLVTWAEIPLVETFQKSDTFAENTRQQLTELIKQNYNHPSICFWSIANEIGGKPAPLLASLDKTAHTLDPNRLTVLATNQRTDNAINFQTDVLGYNRYYGWYYGRTWDLAPWVEQFHAQHPQTPVGITEYGAGASIDFHSDDPMPLDHTEEYQALFHETAWAIMNERPYLWCKLVWNMFDFAVDGRKEGDHAGRNDKGLVTYDRRTRKDAFYFYKANWSKEPVVHITGRRYDNRFGATRPIKVYSNAETVDLVVNGVDLGAQTSPDHVFQWASAPMIVGANTVTAKAVFGDGPVSDTITWQVPARRPDGGYTITDASSYYRLDSPKINRKSGAPIREYRANATNSQIWSFVAVPDGSYTIQNADSGFYLAAAQVKGAWTLIQQRTIASEAQTWRIEPSIFGDQIVHQLSGRVLNNVNLFDSEGKGPALTELAETSRAEWSIQPAIPRDAAGNAAPIQTLLSGVRP
ncbi:MAG: Beta-galactosidase [Capsulimonas sp.]|nr:Beta-galactosidase [Capsulimonas sp.]